jgi:hypothetical protein
MKKFYVYIHCKPNGDPFYVGKGNGKRSHDFYHGRSNWHKRVVAKIGGKEHVKIYVRNCDSEQQAHEHEIWLIAYGRVHGWPLVNMTDGGEGTSGLKRGPLSQERKNQISKWNLLHPEIIKKAQESNIGRKLSPEHCAILMESNKTRTLSSETLKKMSLAAILRFSTVAHPNLGKSLSPEVCAKISNSRLGLRVGPLSAEHCANISAAKTGKHGNNPMKRPVLHAQSGIFFDSVSDAARHYGYGQSTLSRWLTTCRNNPTCLVFA